MVLARPQARRGQGPIAMIQISTSFSDNLQQLPSIDGVQRIELIDGSGAVVATIENQAGKQGSLAVYRYLHEAFGILDEAAAKHGLAVFAEHAADARDRPGAHPNIDRLLDIAAGGGRLRIKLVPAGS
jgi:hypothetical protein